MNQAEFLTIFEDQLSKQREQWHAGISKVDDALTQFNQLKTAVDALEEKAGRPPGRPGTNHHRTPGQALVQSEQYSAFKSMPAPRGRFTINARNPLLEHKAFTPLLSPATGAGHTFSDVMPSAYAQPLPGILQVLSTAAVSAGAIDYLRMGIDLTTQKAKAQNPEGSVKAAISLTAPEISDKIATIAAYTKCSTQMLSDAARLEAFVDGLLSWLVWNEVDREALVGLGPASGEISGLLPLATAYNTALTVTGNTGIDVLSHAVLQLSAVGVQANAAIVSPTAAEGLRLAKSTDGSYLAGYPSTSGNAVTWGLTIIPDANMVGSGSDFLVGNFSASFVQLLVREEMTVDLALQNEDDFIKNLATIRAEMRAALACYMPTAFVKGAIPVTPPAGLMSAHEPENHKPLAPAPPRK